MLEKLTLLNETVLKCLQESDRKKIIQDFTDVGVKILDADFGYSWIYSNVTNNFELAYETPNLPYTPKPPKKGGNNVKVLKTGQPYFVTKVYKRNDKYDLSKHMKAFVIIPMYFLGEVFGNVVICFKQKEIFTKEKRILCTFLGNSIAQAIIIHRLVKSDALLREEKLKTEFMANATHELRTPLAIMKGNIDLALMDNKNLKLAQEALSEVSTEINILSNILRDLSVLTTSSPNTTKILNPIPINLVELIQKLVKRVRVIAQEKNIKIKIKERKKENLFITGDEEYLTELFLNLIKNSLSYGKNNGNTLIELYPEKNTVKIKVIDDGMGISKEDLPKIFDRFYRSDKAHTRGNETHSGLGLAIAKWAAEIHGGTIKAQSTLDKGSTFTVTLPKLMNS